MWPFGRSKNTKGDTPSPVVDAVVIRECSDFEGIEREYELLAERYGQRGLDWEMKQQSLHSRDGRHYDRMDIVLRNGTEESVWFDITDIFGR